MVVDFSKHAPVNPDPREDPKSRSLNGGSYKVPLVVWGPKLGDLLSRSSRGSGNLQLSREVYHKRTVYPNTRTLDLNPESQTLYTRNKSRKLQHPTP